MELVESKAWMEERRPKRRGEMMASRAVALSKRQKGDEKMESQMEKEKNVASQMERRQEGDEEKFLLLLCSKSCPSFRDVWFKIRINPSNPLPSSDFENLEPYLDPMSERPDIDFDLDLIPGPKPGPEHLPRDFDLYRSRSGIAACGSNLYLMGGIDYVTSEAACNITFFAKDHLSSKLQRYKHDLPSELYSPLAITIKDKVYIFGTKEIRSEIFPYYPKHLNGKKNEKYGLGFVFNPVDSTFTEIPKVPIECVFVDSDIHTAVVADQTILFRNGSLMWFFNVENLSWKPAKDELAKSLCRQSWSNRNAVIDNVLYIYRFGRVHAFDFSENKWFKNPVEGLFEDLLPRMFKLTPTEGFVLPLGNDKLCIGFFLLKFKDKRHFYCATFQPVISRPSNGEAFVKAKAVTSTKHVLFADNLLDAVVL